MSILTKKVSPKCLIIGLDGVPYALIQRYISKGYLPNIKRILGDSFHLHQMDASIPDVSSVSWTTFMTGVNPGEHGIYGFLDLHPNSYDIYFPNSNHIQAPAFWDILGKERIGKDSSLSRKFSETIQQPYRSIVLNVPQTYPARPIHGFLVAGFVALDLKKATYPEAAYQYLQSIAYKIDVDADKAKDHKDLFFKELFRVLQKRRMAFHHFFDNEPWDIFVATITETDRLNHFFFDSAVDPNHPYHKPFVSFYSEIDDVVGGLFDKFMDATDGKGLLMILSDHGFTLLQQEVYLNNWLKEAGFLKLNEKRELFDKIDYGTTAFALDPARIYINTEERYPRGTVRLLDKPSVIKDLKDALSALKDPEGRTVIKEIYETKDTYHGPFSVMSPDLVCLAHDGFDLKSTLQKHHTFGRTHFTGMHNRHDAHCIMPEVMQTPSRLSIQDIAGIILYWFSQR